MSAVDRCGGWRGVRMHQAWLGLTGVVLAAMIPVPAAAQGLFWPAPSYRVYQDVDTLRIERRKPRKRAASYPHLAAEPAKDAPKPQGPLTIVVSLDQQRLKIYDDNGVWAESPVSSGTRSNPTPTGLFSVVQKSKWHRSNLYSGAPMPHMQRITWSGVALHAGVLPGYPASHGCIRLPHAFAAKLWSWTKLGVRVVIAADEPVPEPIIHGRLIARLPDPSAIAAIRPAPRSEPKSDADTASSAGPDRVESSLPATPTMSSVSTKPDDAANTRHPAETAEALALRPSVPTQGSDATEPQKPDPVAIRTADASGATLIGPPAPKRSGHIAAFISRKEMKLFVRQDFRPLFEAPITLAEPQRAIGTHIFTAQSVEKESRAVRWMALSMNDQRARRIESKPEPRRGAKSAPEPSAPAWSPSSASEALDRVGIAEEVQERLAAVLEPGSTLIVTDQGFGNETTPKGTDFIVLTR